MSVGKYVDDNLPLLLRQNEFKTFFLDEKLLILKSERPEYTMLINIRHGFNDGQFELFISKPEYYSEIHMTEDAERNEANIYYRCIAALIDNGPFMYALRERLMTFDERIRELKEDEKRQ